MNDDVLLRFLNKGLIDVGGDDDKLHRLRQTAADLTGMLEKSPAKAASFALVAFDPDVPASDPTIAEVETRYASVGRPTSTHLPTHRSRYFERCCWTR